MSRRAVCLLVAAAGCCLLQGDVRAENPSWPPPEGTDTSDPKYWPDDSSYPGMWEMFSFIPESAKSKVRPAELAMGSGNHADRAWQKTIGDDRVIIAFLDSGIRWGERELVNKYYLNRGELPEPDAACIKAGFDPTRPFDANGDGIFNVQDYTNNSGHAEPKEPCDPRLLGAASGWDTNGNGILDPQDLIQIFSDGKDDDNNGYVDDISGWDFFDDDNDANDDTNFGHGTGQAKDAAAEGNNGRSGIGVCPMCRVLMVRAGDSFVYDSNNFGLGVIFAVDSGASVVLGGGGALNNTTLALAAIDYAYYNDALVIGAAGDENAFHMNLPSGNHHAVKVHAIVHDGSKVATSTTFLNFNNCTNYGPRLELSTSGSACSSEATGKTLGIAGMILSAALKADIPFPDEASRPSDRFGARRLTAEEVRQLLIMTVDDIDVPESKTDPTKHPSRPGWEQRFGYGRTNVDRAVEQVLAGKIPPEVDLRSPGWFDVLYPDRQSRVSLQGRLSFRKDRYQSMDVVVEWAAGANPADDEFTQIVEKKGLTEPIDGLIHEWDISKLEIDNPPMPSPDYTANIRMVTVRIRVTANSSTLGAVRGQTRKAFHIERDPDLLPGFPIKIVASGECAPKISDIDGDAKREIILPTSDGLVHAFDSEGKELSGWPVSLNLLPSLDPDNADNVRGALAYTSSQVDADNRYSACAISAAPAIGDLDGDGQREVVVASMDGFVFAFGADGSVRSGFPAQVEPLDLDKVTDRRTVIEEGINASIALADLDDDKKLEIVVPAMDGKIYVWRADGSPQDGFPVLLQDPTGDESGKLMRGRIVSSPAIGDVDGDGTLDIVVGTSENPSGFGPLYVVHGQGTSHPSGKAVHDGWPIRLPSIAVLPYVGDGLVNSPALADLNGDGLPEIVIAGVATAIYILRNTGEQYLPLCFDEEGVDLNQPGWYEHVVACTRKITRPCSEEEAADPKVQCRIGAMNNSVFGELANSDDRPSITLIANCALGDIDNDGVVDVAVGTAGFGAANSFASSGIRGDYDNQMGAWNAITGDYHAGFPQRIDDWQFFLNPTIADIDGDDLPEVISGSAGYWVHAWNLRGEQPEGWPKLAGQWVTAPVAIGDITGDGKLEAVVNTRSGWLYAWKTKGSTKGRIDWESSGHDNHNTRNVETELEQGISAAELPDRSDGGPDGGGDGGTVTDAGDAGPGGDGKKTAGDDDGCSCEASGAPGGTTVLMLLLVVGIVGRRRRRRS